MANTRRDLLRAGVALPAAGLMPAATAPNSRVYGRIGAKPFINLTATYTINGGALSLPEVKRAMEEASYWPVNLDELMDKVGPRLSELLGAESAIVTAGCAAALAHATAGCITGGDPEKMQQVPRLDGLKNEVVMPKESRNVYDHAIRMTGVRIVEVRTLEEARAALGPRTAAIAVLGTAEARGVRLEALVAEGRPRGIPVLVDAAAELPVVPNPFLSRGADLVAYSGGKFLRGPQCAGMLLGRRDLVRAAWVNSSPHHAFGRAMKVGKEEIMGMLAAIEVWRGSYDLQAEYRRWEGWLDAIGRAVTEVDGVSAQRKPPAGASPFPVLDLKWDPKKIGLTAGEIGRQLLDGEPRIMSHAEGEGFGFAIRPVAMQEGEAAMVAARLSEILRTAPKGRPEPAWKPPATNLAGTWLVTLTFIAGTAEHRLALEMDGSRISGMHHGRITQGKIAGHVDGDRVTLRSGLPIEGTTLAYAFTGTVAGETMAGDVTLAEYGAAKWSARRG